MKKAEIIKQDEVIHPIALQQNQCMNLIQIAVEQNFEIEKLKELMDLQDRYDAKNARKSFLSSLSAFQSDLPIIGKNGNVSFGHTQGGGKTEYDFAKLEDVAFAIRPHLVTHGLSYRFGMENNNGLLKIICIAAHIEGHEERTEMESFADNSGKKNGLQQISSAHSYMKRYTLLAAFGIIVGGEDNDASSYEEQGNKEQIQQGEFCSDELFNQSFPAGEAKILAKEKTPEQIIKFFEKKVKLTEDQKQKIINVGKA